MIKQINTAIETVLKYSTVGERGLRLGRVYKPVEHLSSSLSAAPRKVDTRKNQQTTTTAAAKQTTVNNSARLQR